MPKKPWITNAPEPGSPTFRRQCSRRLGTTRILANKGCYPRTRWWMSENRLLIGGPARLRILLSLASLPNFGVSRSMGVIPVFSILPPSNEEAKAEILRCEEMHSWLMAQ